MDMPHTDDRTTTPPHGTDDRHQGISNRETAAQEDKERKDNPQQADEEPQARPHRSRE